MSPTPTFSAQAIGRTEKATTAILDRLLDGNGLTEPQWVSLTVTAAKGGTVERDELAGGLAGALKVSEARGARRGSASSQRPGS
ncbi:MAG: hypothetical protein M3065_14580 [Actinomycetota bacterium]|nr:hypothetical protein [Actinomycetota bacterium]